MDGYYEKNTKGDGKPRGTLRIDVRNLKEFEDLIQQAQNEADQLKKTIDKLRLFDLEIEFGISE